MFEKFPPQTPSESVKEQQAKPKPKEKDGFLTSISRTITNHPILKAALLAGALSAGSPKEGGAQSARPKTVAVGSEKIVEEARAKEQKIKYFLKEQKVKDFLLSHTEFRKENREDPRFTEAFEDLRAFVYLNRDNKQVVEEYADFLAHVQGGVDMSIFHSGFFVSPHEPNVNDSTAREFMLHLLTRETEPVIGAKELLETEKTAKEFLGAKMADPESERNRHEFVKFFDISRFLKIVSGEDSPSYYGGNPISRVADELKGNDNLFRIYGRNLFANEAPEKRRILSAFMREWSMVMESGLRACIINNESLNLTSTGFLQPLPSKMSFHDSVPKDVREKLSSDMKGYFASLGIHLYGRIFSRGTEDLPKNADTGSAMLERGFVDLGPNLNDNMREMEVFVLPDGRLFFQVAYDHVWGEFWHNPQFYTLKPHSDGWKPGQSDDLLKMNLSFTVDPKTGNIFSLSSLAL